MDASAVQPSWPSRSSACSERWRCWEPSRGTSITRPRHSRNSLHHAVAELPAGARRPRPPTDLELDERIDRVFNGAAARLVVGDTDPLTVAAQDRQGGCRWGARPPSSSRAVAVSSTRAPVRRRTSIHEELHVRGGDRGHACRRVPAQDHRCQRWAWRSGCPCCARARPTRVHHGCSLGRGRLNRADPRRTLAWLPVIALAKVNDVPLACRSASLCSASSATAWPGLAGFTGLPRRAAARDPRHRRRAHVIGISGSILGLFVVAFISALLSHAGHLDAAIIDLVEDPWRPAFPDAIDSNRDEVPVVAEPRGPENTSACACRAAPRPRRLWRIAAAMALFEIARATQSLIVWFTVGGFIAIGLDRPISKCTVIGSCHDSQARPIVLG